jgi:hypothetical protein
MENGKGIGKALIMVRQFVKAVIEGDTTILIWLAKNRLGQREKQDHKDPLPARPTEKSDPAKRFRSGVATPSTTKWSC